MSFDSPANLKDLNHRDNDAMRTIYRELRTIAENFARRTSNSIDPTSIVHEAYVRLAGNDNLVIESREHFLALAARAMRHFLVDRARALTAEKRGGEVITFQLDDLNFSAKKSTTQILDLDDALKQLEAQDELKSQIVELRFFGGMTIEEVAIALNSSPASIKRQWTFTKALLQQFLEGDQ